MGEAVLFMVVFVLGTVGVWLLLDWWERKDNDE